MGGGWATHQKGDQAEKDPPWKAPSRKSPPGLQNRRVPPSALPQPQPNFQEQQGSWGVWGSWVPVVPQFSDPVPVKTPVKTPVLAPIQAPGKPTPKPEHRLAEPRTEPVAAASVSVPAVLLSVQKGALKAALKVIPQLPQETTPLPQRSIHEFAALRPQPVGGVPLVAASRINAVASASRREAAPVSEGVQQRIVAPSVAEVRF